MNDALLILHEALSLALAYTVFCRSCRSDADTVRLDIRVAFWLLGVVAVIGIPAPLVWPAIITAYSLALLAGVAAVQIITARYWHEGVPKPFCRPPGVSPGRRACDKGGCCGHS